MPDYTGRYEKAAVNFCIMGSGCPMGSTCTTIEMKGTLVVGNLELPQLNLLMQHLMGIIDEPTLGIIAPQDQGLNGPWAQNFDIQQRPMDDGP
jgi:hypothetical protein